MKFNILILDDERLVCNSLKRILQDDEKNIFTAETPDAAFQAFRQNKIDLLLADYKLKGANGIQVLKDVKEKYPGTVVIMITAFGNIDIAVKAMKEGAYDFIQKKEKPEFIRFIVKRTLDNLRLQKEVEELRETCRKEQKLPLIITQSPKMEKTLELAKQYAKTDATVLITGETGTGKTLLGQYVHLNSPRFIRPFIPINCAAIPSNLIESELFGYEKGAFTGASQKGKRGLIEQADGGTLFLDEISELNLDVQSKLLHILERNEFFRIGAERPTNANVRFISATNANLQEMVINHSFRMDLFYRLNVATLHMPPLNERKEDIELLCKHFIDHFNSKFNKNVREITDEVLNYLQCADWPGNVRELRNMIERAMLLKHGQKLELSDFTATQIPLIGTIHQGSSQISLRLPLNSQNGSLIHEAQKQLILQALQMTGQNRTQAAQILGIPRTSLNFYIKKFKLG